MSRLYSRFLSRIPRVPAFKNASPKMFHDYAVNAVRLYKECFQRWSVRACAFNVTLHDDAVVGADTNVLLYLLPSSVRSSHQNVLLLQSLNPWRGDNR